MALGYFFRLWIFNEGHAPAEQVRVFVARVLRRDAQGGYRIVREFLPMNLLWTHIGGTEAPWLQSRMGQHCEFGRIFRHAHEYFDLAVEVLPLTEWHRLQPGAYRVDLQVAAANCKPALSTVELVFSGQWSNDEAQMFREGVALTVFGPAARERVFD